MSGRVGLRQPSQDQDQALLCLWPGPGERCLWSGLTLMVTVETHWPGGGLLGETFISVMGKSAGCSAVIPTLRVLGQPVNVHLAEEVTWLCHTFLLGTAQSPLMKPMSQGNRCCPTEGLLCCPLGIADPCRACLP